MLANRHAQRPSAVSTHSIGTQTEGLRSKHTAPQLYILGLQNWPRMLCIPGSSLQRPGVPSKAQISLLSADIQMDPAGAQDKYVSKAAGSQTVL